MTEEELEVLLLAKRREKAEQQRREREAYEKYINDTTGRIVKRALKLRKIMGGFHASATEDLNAMREKLDQYGEIKSTSKGGFSRITPDGQHKLVYRYTTICAWDERAEKAEGLLRDFLRDFVKKRDLKMYNVISALLERNAEGNLEYSRIQSLYSQENEFDDPRWKEAIRLFKEAFRPASSKMRIEVYERNSESGKWESVSLNLSSY
jgi:hypothetical protein